MDQLAHRWPYRWSTIVFILPFGLWGMLWLSIGTGDGSLRGIADPGNQIGFLQGVRATFPFAAALLALLLILVGFRRQGPRRFLFFNPLGLAAVYGLFGVAASLLSPQGSVALYWVAVYLSVPLVLWGIANSSDTLERIRRVINFNWLIILLAVAILFVIGLLYLNLGALILNPTAWFECSHHGSWERLTFQFLRQTGVGRYAALGAIIAIGGLWQGKWRYFWGMLLLAALLMLASSGARTAYAGFAIAAPLVVLLYGGKKAALAGGVAFLVLVPVLWTAGIPQTFMSTCLNLGLATRSPVVEQDIATVRVPSGTWALQPLTPQEPAGEEPPAQIKLTTGEWTLNKRSAENSNAPDPQLLLQEPPGVGGLEPISNRDSAVPSSTGRAEVPQGQGAVLDPPAQKEVLAPQVDIAAGTASGLPSPEASVAPDVSTQGQASAPQADASPGPASGLPSPEASVAPDVSTQGGAPAQQADAAAGPERGLPSPEASVAPDVSTQGQASAPQVDTAAGPAQLTTVSPREREAATEGLLLKVLSGEWMLQLIPVPDFSTTDLFTLSGRTAVWAEGLRLFKQSPLLGFGFHADRLLLGTHMHNAFLHALLQTGLLGTIPFVAALLLAWGLLIRVLLRRSALPSPHQHLVVQTAGVLAFLSVRAIPESTGAFFGVDWLLLAPLLFYVQLLNQHLSQRSEMA